MPEFRLGRNLAPVCCEAMAPRIQSRNAPAMPRKSAKHPRAVKAREEPPHVSLQELFESIAEMGRKIPPEVRAKIPRDFAKNVDHYLYGHSKVN